MRLALFLFAGLFFVTAQAQSTRYVDFRVENARGIDAAVDYRRLAAFGPWDDRNYELTAEDLRYLRADEASILDAIPAFYRVLARKANPALLRPGARFPRSAVNVFRQRFGGYLIDGTLYRGVERRGGQFAIVAESELRFDDFGVRFVAGEVRVTDPNGAAESAIAIKPADDNIVLAGTNGPGSGQQMHRSTDGGETWSQIALPLGGTCCDPTLGWSSDSRFAYTATLGGCGSGSCNIWFYRSDDDGQSWNGLENATPGDPRRELTSAGISDKEYLHVDTFPGSPHLDNIYLTWHDNNVMQFARSTDFGVSFDPVMSFSTDPTGIGSDITTDRNGDVYYIWPSFMDGIQLRKSTDGGQNFAPAITISPVQDDFDFAIPVMETRRVFQYVSVDVDYTSGTFSNSIYVAWTDNTGPEDPNPANNHARIQVAYSRDGGANWTVTTPHPTADQNSVDRFHQWLDVDEAGRLHLIFYDTTGSGDRNSVDVVYTYSNDGGASWSTPVPITGVMSPNISDGFEWGDYNGLDTVGSEIVGIWTDNRDENSGGAESVDVYAAGGFGEFAPGFALSGAQANPAVCAPGTLTTDIDVASISGFSDPVTLSAPTLPTGFSNAQFSPTQLTPPGTSSLQVDVADTVSAGEFALSIQGNSAAQSRNTIVNVSVSTEVPAQVSPQQPVNAANVDSTRPTLGWSASAAAMTYRVEIDESLDFATPIVNEMVAQTSFTPQTPLPSGQLFYWRVTPINVCGMGLPSLRSTFEIPRQYCSAPDLAIPDGSGSASDLLSVGDSQTVAGLTLAVDLPHGWVGDLEMSLTHGTSGAEVVILDQPGRPSVNGQFGCGGDDVDAIFDDAAANVAETDCGDIGAPGLVGVFQPLGTLADFDGLELQGDWTLAVADLASQFTGRLVEWCLIPASTTSRFVLDVVLAGAGQGQVLSDPLGIACAGDCAEDYIDGTLVVLEALPEPGSEFSGWSGACSGTGSCQVTMDQLRSVTASFNLSVDGLIFEDSFEDLP